MSTKKYLSLERLTEYDTLIKSKIDADNASVKSYVDTEVAKKADSSHTHDDKYYTETEIDEKINSIPNYVVRNIEDVTRIAEKSTMVGFYFYLNDPIPNGLYYYDRSKYNGRILYAVIVNKEGTAVEKQFPVYHPILLAISSDEESVDIISISDVSTTEAYYDIVNKTYTLTEKTYSAIQIDTKISDLNTFITEQLSLKAESNHTHDDRYYTETEIDSKLSAVNTSIGNITSGSTPVKEAEHADSATSSLDAEKLGGQLPSYYAKASDIPTGALANKNSVSESDLDTALAEKVNAASEGNHSHLNKTVLDGITSAKVSAWDSAESNAKTYADNAATTAANKVKNDLLNGAGTAYDTLKELGELIDDNKDAIDALEDIASGKADATHGHEIADVSGLQSALDGKAASSHGTHVTFDSTNKPKMDGTAAFGTSTKVARADHVHPTDTSRASKTEFDTHVADTTKHITSTERTNWGTAYTHSQAAHAPSNAEKNQNAFSNIIVGETTIAADTTTDSLTLVGSNVTITPDATNDKVTIAVASGSTSTAGILKLTNSTSSTSTTTAATPSSVKSAYDLANQAKTAAATAQSTADGKANASHTHKVADITDLTATATELNYMDGVTSSVQTQLDGKAASGHSHSDATTSAAGFMTAAMVTKLNGIATGANKTTVDSTLSSSSTNPVQNKVVNSAIVTATNAITANTNSISTHTSQISALQTAVGEFEEITSEEIQELFA